MAGCGLGNPNTISDPINGVIGSANGLGTVASFYGPNGIAMDASENLYVADQHNQLIRKITPAGIVTTFAGNGAAGAGNGPATSASFNSPSGIAVDKAGNVYVADALNEMIRKITPAGIVSTFAGSGLAGAHNGPAASASFNNPNHLAVDAGGVVYVADYGNNMIRKITPDGTVSTLAGSGASSYTNGAGAKATFTSIRGIAVDNAGNVFVSDLNTVRKITRDGFVSTIAGRSVSKTNGPFVIIDGKCTAASFAVTEGISIDAAGNLYVGDNNAIRKINRNGTVTTLAGGAPGASTDGMGDRASFGILRGLVVNPRGTRIYVADFYTSLIRKIEIQ